ncbi:hypothetical protein HDU87_005597 [Geranomyces variabilis]|uniref:AAA+ ATPase domain-containing protein n=1 Tax=Geranomyces variabilis TaxID=109894 RepID=A0AAD5TI84_9FUNG|nr:hypothetical protein HDU87_005597 [Geranomyces variabilis]
MDSDEDEESPPSKSNKKLANLDKDSFKSASDVLVRSDGWSHGSVAWILTYDFSGQMPTKKPMKVTAVNSRHRHTVPLEPRVLYRHSTHATHAIKYGTFRKELMRFGEMADGRKALGGQGKVADDRLKNLPPQLVEVILNEILEGVAEVTWDDIVGLTLAKATIRETVVFPMQRPDIFCGLRSPAKGVLLYGPPGTGKTLIGKTIASQCHAKFFSITASSLTSKWIGDGEKLVRCLFAVARVYQPSVIFIDEIDALLGKRKDGEHDATRRMKTEFLVQFDGCGTDSQDRILLVGATNRPQELDEAIRRRFRKRLYIPLPDSEARAQMITNRIATLDHGLSDEQIATIVERTDGYSGSDMDGLVREASLGPIRAIEDIQSVEISDIRKVVFDDFLDALSQVKASVSPEDLESYQEFDGRYGSVSRTA